jgi:hypothetical protein
VVKRVGHMSKLKRPCVAAGFPWWIFISLSSFPPAASFVDTTSLG